jgi:hypothetical protein
MLLDYNNNNWAHLERIVMIYMVRIPADDETCLDWFQVFGTKNEAMDCAKDFAQGLGWEVRYLKRSTGYGYCKFQGEKTIVVEQCTSYYHGA